MDIIADFHIHSKYSRATSSQMDIENLDKIARLKGVNLLGTGDFTHPLWILELKKNLEPFSPGIYKSGETFFILTCEVCNIFYLGGKTHMIHNIIFVPDFKSAEEINRVFSSCGNLYADGRAILHLSPKDMLKRLIDINPLIFVVPAHIWTPHFSLFGENSGFDTIEECFGEYSGEIFALETGLSSDPGMNRRLTKLDKHALISNSDAHSPSKIGREANVFNLSLDYNEIREVIKNRDNSKFLYTIEFFPQEGKYHFDGHRKCGVCFSPRESKKNNDLCPRCRKKLTIGVMHRVEELSDREEGFAGEQFIPFKNLIPLAEIIAEAKGVNTSAKSVELEYIQLVKKFKNEMNILLKVSGDDLKQHAPAKTAEGILRVRRGDVKIQPGYDGEYGKIEIFPSDDKEQEKQLTFF